MERPSPFIIYQNIKGFRLNMALPPRYKLLGECTLVLYRYHVSITLNETRI